MKKVLLTAVAVFAFGFANAQESTSYKPTKGTITTEVGLIGGLNNADFALNTGVLKFRYFLKDDLGLRLGLGLKNTMTEGPGIAANSTVTAKDNDFTLKAGAEKHFAGTERLSTYAGLDLQVGFQKEFDETTQQNGDFTSSEQKSSNFGVNLFTGADYYIAKKVFLGVEAGINVGTSKDKDLVSTARTGNTTVTTTTPGGKGSNLTTTVFGGVRIGYQF